MDWLYQNRSVDKLIKRAYLKGSELMVNHFIGTKRQMKAKPQVEGWITIITFPIWIPIWIITFIVYNLSVLLEYHVMKWLDNALDVMTNFIVKHFVR